MNPYRPMADYKGGSMPLDANQQSERHIDQAKSDAFAEQMLSILNHGALS